MPFETFALPMVWWVNKLPWIVIQDFIPLYSIGWLDTYRVQIIPFIANAFSIYLFYSYFQSIPKDLDEAARVDGAGWFRIYRSVIMPLAGPAIATVAILTFLPAWNSYLWPLMVVQTEDLRPVMVGISYFQQLNVLVGPDHGLLDPDHHPGARVLPRLPALLRQQHRLRRRQGIIRFSRQIMLGRFPPGVAVPAVTLSLSPTRNIRAGFGSWPIDKPRVPAPGT